MVTKDRSAPREARRRARLARKGFVPVQFYVPPEMRDYWIGVGREIRGGARIEAVVVRDPNGRVATIPLKRL